MADVGPEPGGRGEGGGAVVRADPGPSGRAACVAPLDPEQLRRVLEQVTKAQAPLVLQDAAQHLAPRRGPGARAPRPPRPPLLLPPQQLEAICVTVSSREKRGQPTPGPPAAALQPQAAPPRPQLLLGPRPQPVFRLLTQKPQPTLQPARVKRAMAPEMPSVGGPTTAPQPTPHLPAVTGVCLGPPNTVSRARKKLRRSLRVQTRSGRISRPPRYKARDYKFIKTEDLADGRQSNSDDYSELSAEEEEEEERACPLPFELSSCSLKPKMFQCQACDKAYIGKGGLARHLKLHPGHGQPEPGGPQSRHAPGTSTEGHQDVDPASLTSVEPSTPSDFHSAQGGLQHCQLVEGGEALVLPPADGRPPAPLEGPERSGVSMAPPEGSAGAQSMARLHELLQQCDQEQLVELVLPRLTRAVTVYEFLLMRVQQGPSARPDFPAVYREFELLHQLVKGLCRDYVDSGGGREPLDVSNCELAKSLGVPEPLRKDRGHMTGVPPQRHETAEQGCSPVKRLRRDSATHDATEPQTVASRGSASDTQAGSPTGEVTGHTDVVHTGQLLIPFADLEARSSSAQPLTLCHATRTPWAEPGRSTPDPMSTCPKEGTQGHACSPPATRGLGEGKASGGDLLGNGGPQPSSASPLGSHPGLLGASQRALEGTMSLEVPTGTPL